MKYGIAILSLIALFISGCDDDPVVTPGPPVVTKDTIPSGVDTATIHSCVLEKILYLEARGAAADTVAIAQYYYNGQIVYLYYAECCDRYNALCDSMCNVICLPTGGLAGTGDGTCPDFVDRAYFIKNVWQK